MYVLASQVLGQPVLSLQNADTLTRVAGLVIDPVALEVIALRCEPIKDVGPSPVLLMRDVREVALDCILVNAVEDLAEAGDIVRLERPLLERFDPLGMTVQTDMRRHLGKVEDFTINLSSYCVQKLYVRQSIVRSWLGSSLIIDRQQIVEITPTAIIVRDSTVAVPGLEAQA